jgi:hypothetical protein
MRQRLEASVSGVSGVAREGRFDHADPPSRDRHARHRARRKAGVAVALVEYDGAVLDWLVRLHWLDEASASNRAAVGDAISRMVAASAKR